MEISRRSFVLLLFAGILVRLVLIGTSIGTNDIINWMAFSGLVDHVGIGPGYARMPALNHPPLSLAILLALERLRQLTGIEIGDLLRLTQLAFDLLAVAALLNIGRSIAWPSPRALALFYFLSPVSIFVSAFHGNTDPAMVALLLAALSLLVRMPAQPFTGGLLFAAAIGIKIVPLLLLPLVLVCRRDRLRVAAGVVAGTALIFVPALATGGLVVLERIFLYGMEPGNYGLPFLMLSLAGLVAGTPLAAASDSFVTIASAWVAVGRHAVAAGIAAYSLVIALRHIRGDRAMLAACGTALLIALVLSPGIGLQYFVWPIAFLPFALSAVERWTLVGVLSIAQFTAYTIWSDGFPWWYADSTASRANINLVWLGNFVWVALLVLTIRAVIRTVRAV